ncbi:MAG: cysteine hydrolase [Bryobacteraceae bacterium]|nr:cysteine hydrolase [Bryobacteraceae bacterium]
MKTVFIDVDTQIDFVFPAGSLYVPGAEQIVPVIARLNAHASASNIPLVCTTDAHPENDPEFRMWPPHCIVGTVGQQKPQVTLVPNQTLFRKVTTNAFAAPGFSELLDSIGAERYVVYGVVTEICVSAVIRGLLQRNHARIELVTDAVRHLDPTSAHKVFTDLTSASGYLVPSEQMLR